jgi:hypothetical protein
MTTEELETVLLKRGMRSNAVSFRDGVASAAEQYFITKEGSIWEVYYYERGNKNDLRSFVDEADACLHLLSILEKDKTVWDEKG